ncbi:MAG: hypothetical protein R3F59_07155 [Myxococcota bacterium]
MFPAPLRVTLQLALVPPVLLSLAACVHKVDRLTIDRVVAVGTDVGDTRKVCAMGEALAHPLAAVGKHSRPELALTIAEGTAAVCDEADAWEAELAAERADANLPAGPGRVAEITDARERARRANAHAAERFERSFQAMQAAFGEVGATGAACPKIAEKDEFVYAFGLVTGTLALLHDRQAGGANDIPMDRLAVIARAADCLDDARWWHLPSALRGSAWAAVPGSGPEDVDPWALLEEAASAGAPSGVRVARAMQVLIAGNGGRTDVMTAALAAHAASLDATPQNTDWALLDAYATEVSLHQSDLLWTRERGHRTERFGEVPADEAPPAEPQVPDLFGDEDPFGSGEAPDAPEGDPGGADPQVPH